MLNGAGIEAVEAHARAVGGDGEDLGAVAAIDLDGVGAVAALGQIGIVAGVPDHAVVAGLAEHLVVAVPAGQRVVAIAAVQKVGALAANERVVASSAIKSKFRDAGRQLLRQMIVSLPPPPFTTRASFAPSDAVMFTRAGRPATATAVPDRQ